MNEAKTGVVASSLLLILRGCHAVGGWYVLAGLVRWARP